DGCGRRWHANSLPPRPVSRHRRLYASGPGRRRRNRALRFVSAAGERYPRSHGAADEGDVLAMIGLHKAVFLDKDGTLVENVPYNVDPSLIRLTANAAEGLVRL